MKFFTKLFFTLLIVVFALQLHSQKRYLEPVFDDVEVSDVQVAGSNFTILSWLVAAQQGLPGNTVRQPLPFSTFTPEGDTETERPLVLYIHTGNFFPFPLNGSCSGTMMDSTNVEIATRLAKMGYVVATIDYRQGWAFSHPMELVRRFQLINAAYKGVQDVNTYIRYFKRSVDELGNPYGIDPEKIVVWGQGTGGYLSLAAAYLNEQDEITNTSDPNKFLFPLGGGASVAMVTELYNGNIDGTSDLTFVDATYSAISGLPEGDTITAPNHIGFSSDFALAVNMGGALGDSTWISEGEVPLVSFHGVDDEFADYNTDVLLVPTADGPQPVVEVSGSYDVQRSVTRFGLNDVFNTIPEGNDPYGADRGEDFIGLMSFDGTPNDTGAPWEWTDLDTPGLTATDCNPDADIAKTYIDSIIGFYAPRGCVALGLNCDFAVSTKEIELDASYLTVSPNPAQDFITIRSDKADLEAVTVYGLNGQILLEQRDLSTRSIRIERNDIPKGMYIVKAKFEEGVAVQKIMFN